MTTSPVAEVGLDEVYRLRQAGVIGADGFLRAAVAVRDDAHWSLWARRALLAVGLAHLLAGVVFFFAWNWADMPAWAKLALIGAGIIAAAVGSLLAGLDRRAGEASLITASVLVGVLLAVVGQVFQTGADAFELFLAWTLLVLPWTLASRSAAHWLLWLVLLELAIGLWATQVLEPDGRITGARILIALGLLAGLALAAREAGVRLGADWLAGEWTRLILLAATLGILFATGVGFVFDLNGEPAAAAALVAGLILAGLAYRFPLPSFAALSIVVGFAGLFLMAAAARLLTEAMGFDFDWNGVAVLALLVLWCLLVTGAAAMLLRRLRAVPGMGA